MQPLREMQKDFAEALLDGAGHSWGHTVYRGNAFGNWTEALANAYPILRKIVGVNFFNVLARDYAREHPSTSGDLNEFGRRLPKFVAAWPQTLDLPYLPDVARMEWRAHLAHHAANAPAFDAAAVARLPPERYAGLRPLLAPACSLMRSDWPLGRIWAVHQEGYAGEIDVDLAAGVDRVLIHRPRWRTEVASVATGDFRFLAGAGRGRSLGKMVDGALAVDPSFDPAHALLRWVQAGALFL